MDEITNVAQLRLQKIDSRPPIREDITELLQFILEQHSKSGIKDLLIGYTDQESGQYYTHVVPESDIAVLNLGADLLKQSVFSFLDVDDEE